MGRATRELWRGCQHRACALCKTVASQPIDQRRSLAQDERPQRSVWDPPQLLAYTSPLTRRFRWRRQSPQRNQRPHQAHSRDRSIGGSGHNTPTPKQDADRSSYSGNVWGQKGRGDAQRQAQANRQSAPPAAAQQGYQEQAHRPVNGFNSKETKDALRKCAYPLEVGLRGTTTAMDNSPSAMEVSGVVHWE